MRRIAIINQKGGVGKTTTAANLGAALARIGKRVLVVDMDPQANLSLYLGTEVGPDEPSVYPVLCGGMPAEQAIRETRTPGLYLLPAHIDLSGAELELASTFGRETILRDALDELERTCAARGEELDFVLLDCPPSLGLLSINALTAAREVMLVVQTEFFALQGLSKLVEVVHLIRRRLNPELEIMGLLPCLYDSRLKLAREVLGELRRFFPDQVFSAPIRTNVKLAESPSHSLTIFEYAPESNGARDYEALAAELLARGGEEPGPPPERESDRRGEALLETARALREAESQANQRRLEDGEQLRVRATPGGVPADEAPEAESDAVPDGQPDERSDEPAEEPAPHSTAASTPASSPDPGFEPAPSAAEDAPAAPAPEAAMPADPRPAPPEAPLPAPGHDAHASAPPPHTPGASPDPASNGAHRFGEGVLEDPLPVPELARAEGAPPVPPLGGPFVAEAPGDDETRDDETAAEEPAAEEPTVELVPHAPAPTPAPPPAEVRASGPDAHPPLSERSATTGRAHVPAESPEAEARADERVSTATATREARPAPSPGEATAPAEPALAAAPEVVVEAEATPDPEPRASAPEADADPVEPEPAASAEPEVDAPEPATPEPEDPPLRPAPLRVYTWGDYIGEDRHVPGPRE